jgi:hypothetical protein
VQPFLDTACTIAQKQLKDGHGFVLEIPHKLSGSESERVRKLLSSDEVHSWVGKTYGDGFLRTDRDVKATWWLVSSEQFINEANLSLNDKGAAKVILDGFCHTLNVKEPSSLVCLAKSLDARIRAAGMFADENMSVLGADLTT